MEAPEECQYPRSDVYCTKNVQIGSFFWSVFSHIWTEHGDLLRLQF